MATIIITANEAKNLTKKSKAFYEDSMKRVMQDVVKAANNGQSKVLFPCLGSHEIEQLIKDELVLLGYRIDRWDSETWNAAIHW